MQTTKTDELKLTDLATVDKLLKSKVLYDTEAVARITGYCVTYVRRLCHTKKIAHKRLLGRYYLTSEQVAGLIQDVKPAPSATTKKK